MRVQLRKFITKHTRCIGFHLADDGVRSDRWRRLCRQVHTVGKITIVTVWNACSSAFSSTNARQPLRDLFSETRLRAHRAPDEMVGYVPRIGLIVLFHKLYLQLLYRVLEPMSRALAINLYFGEIHIQNYITLRRLTSSSSQTIADDVADQLDFLYVQEADEGEVDCRPCDAGEQEDQRPDRSSCR